MNHRQTPDFRPGKAEGLISKGDTHLRVTKGALSNGLAACSSAEIAEGRIADIHTVKEQVQQYFEEFSRKGFRTLGVAYKDIGSDKVITREQEADRTFWGFLILFDPPKTGITETLRELKHLGVSLEVITGDNRLLAANVSQQGVLLLILHATTDQFRTGWVIESVISVSVSVLVIRTRKSFFRSKPGKVLRVATLLVVVVTVLFPSPPLQNS
jgi:hypothetical protein